jgi:CRP-like cAMP-binding protein
MSRGSSRRRAAEHPIFADLRPPEIKALRKAAQPMSFPAGATIQVVGHVDRRCFVVFDGLVLLSDATMSMECGPGGVFGDAGGYGRALPATAVAKTQVRTFMIPSLVMANLMNSNPRLAARVANARDESSSLAG